ncbi:MAG TPA: hemerythrin domain-containing protein [Thermoanaerobaculia bacterium]|nr:hemerythrin domain-containing protein [Thermoanaerobaculia bacterium]
MRLLEELRAEHELIDRVAGSLRTFAAARARGEGGLDDGAAFRRFFRLWAGAWHHAREEETLFPALAAKAELSPAHGPIAAFVEQHQEMAKLLDELEPLLGRDPLGAEDARRLVDLVTAYTRELGRHIDAENSVLLPESEVRLRHANVLELAGRAPTAEELAARVEGERLAGEWPFTVDAGGVRGEGCVVCPSYGTTCRGVEAEWWNDSEWEEFSDHLG